MEARGGQRCGVIYLFAEARGGEGGPARARFPGHRWQPQAACTSSESAELHAAKTRLGTGAPGSSLPKIVPRLRARSKPPAAGLGLGWLWLLQPSRLLGMGMCRGSSGCCAGIPVGMLLLGRWGFTARTPVTAAMPGCGLCGEPVAPGPGTGSCLLGPSPASAWHHLGGCLGMEGWTSTITATLPGALRGPRSAVAHGLACAGSHPLEMESSSTSSCHAMPCKTVPCHAVPCHTVPCHAM